RGGDGQAVHRPCRCASSPEQGRDGVLPARPGARSPVRHQQRPAPRRLTSSVPPCDGRPAVRRAPVVVVPPSVPAGTAWPSRRDDVKSRADRAKLASSGDNGSMAPLEITASRADPALLDLPWETPLEQWPDEILAALPRGISRHVVRFVRVSGRVLALKEISHALAQREYEMLRVLGR